MKRSLVLILAAVVALGAGVLGLREWQRQRAIAAAEAAVATAEADMERAEAAVEAAHEAVPWLAAGAAQPPPDAAVNGH